ncbi:hypothetical protein INT47_004111 [Mucor saturninus]|uniref:Uncharacterized protein n=1 Tax=Mucor saturninus TaxID=64648 RepID=A0A8H7R5K0_9FUNG|nr:hypothetical protein INT47_004111 [Mucor saturninus]
MAKLDLTTEYILKGLTEKTDREAVKGKDHRHQKQCEGTHFRVEESDLVSYFETLTCFCKRPVSRYYTLEYGAILECASYDETKPFFNPRFVCGFHVHEIAWLRLYEQLLQGYTICSRLVELRACPLFNFTYCALFKVHNDYPSVPVGLPTCFCRKPIKMVHEQQVIKKQQDTLLKYLERTSIDQPNKIITNFICANRNEQGVTKCDWMNSADLSVFPKPKNKLHSQVDHSTYHEYTASLKLDVSAYLATTLF